MPESLEIVTFGGLQIRRAGEPILTGTSRKAAALFVYLACTRTPQAREALADLLWDDRTPAQASSNLRTLLTILRPQVGPYLVATPTTVAIHPALPYSLDLTALEAHLAAARAGGRPRDSLTAEQVAALEAAVDLYKGAFLQGFHVRDCRGFEEWMLAEQGRIEQAILEALHRLVEHALDSGDYFTGIRYAQRLLQIDALDEAAHRTLMRLLAYTGQRSAALAQYELCERVFAGELGATPEPATRALAESIRAGVLDAVAGPAPGAATAVHPPRPQTLPFPTTPFVGRTAELATLHGHLIHPHVRLISVVGPAASGKTRLAIQAAESSPGFPGGICFVALPGEPLPAALLGAIAEAVRYPSASRLTSAGLGAYLAPRDLLLVLDGFAPAPARTVLLADLLQRAPRLKCLVTARQPLRLPGETVLDLAPLPLPLSLLLDGLAQADDARRGEVYAALARLRAAGPLPVEDRVLYTLLQTEIRAAYGCCVVYADLYPDGLDHLLSETLNSHWQRNLERIFTLLAILYPDVDYAAFDRALPGTPSATPRPGVAALLAGRLPSDLAETLLPLLDAPANEIVARAAGRFALPRRALAERLAELVHAPDPWLCACAIFRIGALRLHELSGVVREAVARGDMLVRETALEACQALLEPAQFHTMLAAEAARPLAPPSPFMQTLLQSKVAG